VGFVLNYNTSFFFFPSLNKRTPYCFQDPRWSNYCMVRKLVNLYGNLHFLALKLPSFPNTNLSTYIFNPVQFNRSVVSDFATPWTAACQASLSIISSRSLPKLMSSESVMPSSHLILCCPLLLPPSVLPSIRVFSNESALHIRWPKYWSFSFSISPSNEYSGLISFRMNWLDVLAVPGTL